MPSKALVSASTRPLILTLLRPGESYGYEIIERVRSLSGGMLEWSDGMLYPLLRRLEADGLVESRWVTAENDRRRRYYRLTRAGRRAEEVARTEWSQMSRTMAAAWAEGAE
jgi:DNA-binding PadR family transcriptional regulator